MPYHIGVEKDSNHDPLWFAAEYIGHDCDINDFEIIDVVSVESSGHWEEYIVTVRCRICDYEQIITGTSGKVLELNSENYAPPAMSSLNNRNITEKQFRDYAKNNQKLTNVVDTDDDKYISWGLMIGAAGAILVGTLSTIIGTIASELWLDLRRKNGGEYHSLSNKGSNVSSSNYGQEGESQ